MTGTDERVGRIVPDDVMKGSIDTRESLIAYLELRRLSLTITAEHKPEREKLARWIAWLKGAI